MLVLRRAARFIISNPFTSLYFVFAGCIPSATILLLYDRGQEYVLFYGHLLVYPLVYGVFAAWAAERVFREKIDFLLSAAGKKLQYITMIAIFSAVAIAIELSSGTHMEFEGSPQAINSEKALQGVIPALLERGFGENNPLDERARVEYIESLGKIVASPWNVKFWSIGRWVYLISFAFQAATLLAIFISAAVLLRQHSVSNGLNDEHAARSLQLIAFSIVLVTPWVLMRAGFEINKAYLFGDPVSRVEVACIIFLQLVALLFIVGTIWHLLAEKIVPAVGVLIAIAGGYVSYTGRQDVIKVFGGGHGFRPHFIIGAALLFFAVTWWWNPLKSSNNTDHNRK